MIENRQKGKKACLPRLGQKASSPLEVVDGAKYEKYFTVTFEQDSVKRTLCPYQIEENIAHKLKGKPKSVTSSGQNGLLVETGSKEQSERIMLIKEIMDKECTVRSHAFFNKAKGVIYVNNSEITDLESFRDGLRERYGIAKVERVTWITLRNPRSKAF